MVDLAVIPRLISRLIMIDPVEKYASGKLKAFRSYQTLLDNGATSPECPLCQDADHTLEHWLMECAGTAEAAFRAYGFRPTHLGVMSEFTKETVALARATLSAL